MNDTNFIVLKNEGFSDDQIDYLKSVSNIDDIETHKQFICLITDLTNILYEYDNRNQDQDQLS